MPAMEGVTPQMEGEQNMQPLASQPIIHCHRHNLKNRFDLIKTLGEGTYGKVKLAVELSTGEKVAIKYIRKKKIQDDQDLNRIRREIKVMAKLQHPHIINVREVFENREKIVMVMDFASGGELYDYINSKQRLDDRDARRIFRQIVSAVYYCHENGVVHRDLKLENIVLDDNGNVRIADFGLSNFYTGQDLLTTYCGSPLYSAPEIVNGIPYQGPEVDCWSLGVLLYTLVYGTMPFYGKDFKTLRKQISSADYFQPLVLSDAAGLIEEILTPNPEDRATMSRIASHWWVNVGFSSTPTGTSYDGGYMQTQHPQFSILNFLSNNDCGNNSYRSKCDLSKRDKNRRSYASCDILNSNHLSEANSFKKGAISVENLNSKWQSGTQSDDSDTLSNYSLEETKTDAKPTRSILKKRGKFSISDSGCGLEEDACSARSSGPVSPVMSDLSYELCDIQSVLGKETIQDSSISKDDGLCLSQSPAPTSEAELKTKDSPEAILQPADAVSKAPVRRGILKRPKKSSNIDARNRNSLGSQGSNSSSDLLDFSYDSSDQLEGKYSLTITIPDESRQQQLKSKYMYSPTGTRQPEFDFSPATVKQRESNYSAKQSESNSTPKKFQSTFSAARAKLLEIENSSKQTDYKLRPSEFRPKSTAKTKPEELNYNSIQHDQRENYATTKPPKPNYRVTKKITLNPAPVGAKSSDNAFISRMNTQSVHNYFASMSLDGADFQKEGAIEDCDLQEARDIFRRASAICSMKTL